MLGEPERGDEHGLRAVRHLRAVPDGERLVGGIEFRHHAARLDRMAAALVEMEALGDPMRSAGESLVDVAVIDRCAGDEIVRAVEPHPRRTRRDGGEGIDDAGSGSMSSATSRAASSATRRLAATTIATGSPTWQTSLVSEPDGIDIEPDRRRRQRQRNAVAGHQRPQVGIGEHGLHAFDGARRGGIDMTDLPVGDRASHERGMQHAGKRDVVDEPPGPAQQLVVLEPQHAAPEESCRWLRIRRHHRPHKNAGRGSNPTSSCAGDGGL